MYSTGTERSRPLLLFLLFIRPEIFEEVQTLSKSRNPKVEPPRQSPVMFCSQASPSVLAAAGA
jgi:hypothetical protein